jgi:hypothetical protein
MLAKERESICATVSLRVIEHQGAGKEPQRKLDGADEAADASGTLFEFAGSAPATFAERFPHLMVGAIAAAVILTTLTAEIECLRAMGYYWR